MKKIILSIIVAIMMATMTTTATATEEEIKIGLNLESSLVLHPDWTMSISRVEIGGFISTELGVGMGMSIAQISIDESEKKGSLWGGFFQIDLMGGFPLLKGNLMLGELGGENISLKGIKVRFPLIFPFQPAESIRAAVHLSPYIGFKYAQYDWGWMNWGKKGPIAGITLLTNTFSIFGEMMGILHSHILGKWEYRWIGFILSAGVTFRF